ncbi:MAG: FAD-binding oxidoreductase [Geminicoccaceae bacterium]|nr:FAD-binding oxidoreductase [Geminicoccaceae bacterium]
MPDIVIVGGGISGTSAAFELAHEGHAVTLIEARDLAAMASGWTLGGVRQSGRHPAELPLARAAVKLWETMEERLGVPSGYRQKGNLRIARDEAEAGVIKALVEEQGNQGLAIEWLDDTAAIREIAPAVTGKIVAASFCASDGQAEPSMAVAAFASAAQRYGARIRTGIRAVSLMVEGDRVRGVMTDKGPVEADRVVVAAGVHAPELLQPLGLNLPLDLRLVCALQSEPVEPMLEQVLGVANADCAGRQQMDGRFRVTSGIGPWGGQLDGWREEDLHPRPGDIAAIAERISALIPPFAEMRVARIWGGLIDMTPDGLPVLDVAQEVEGLVIAAGFSGHGFCLGPATGEIVADLALGRECRHPIGPFSLKRMHNLAPGGAPLTLHG